MGSITLNKPSGGQLTLSPEDGATNETVTIPSVGVGKVLQVVEGFNGTYQGFNGTSGWLDLTATITPLSATSRILVMVHIDGTTTTDNDLGSYGNFQLYRNHRQAPTETLIRNFGYPKGWDSADNASGTTVYTQVVDSPNTTNATSYDVYWLQRASTAYQEINRDGPAFCVSSIILMEVAA